ncbi:amino acid oxidase [Enterovibrio norvegicus]|uniref:FAD-dependent oxidoreductase n=1 Tax=Enterovibrio norvegicus TaxID=188144 RepID=UPI0002E5FBE6|nr:FAD-dependent oxidoreductase [Enterovibrio norvegicus]OEE68517.1 amino acid oxidase [Enterovibrio norvegicus]
MKEIYDVAIVGGGFFGLYIAEYYSSIGKSVIVLEKESEAMTRASYVNQARVHNGYHYPRSALTALRSKASFPVFVNDFRDCVDDEFDKYYMVSHRLGKVTSTQFEKFCNRIGIPCEDAEPKIKALVNPNLVHGIFKTKEYAFNSKVLREIMLDRLSNYHTLVSYEHVVESISYCDTHDRLTLHTQKFGDEVTLIAKHVFNCTYSMINRVLQSSEIDLIPLKHELTEMCIVDVPYEFEKMGITIMCGPFFSVMPFPSKEAHSFSHVRYTPHFEWMEAKGKDGKLIDTQKIFESASKKSAWTRMVKDAARYIPLLSESKYRESLWEVKTILPRSDVSDSRPILFKTNYVYPGFHCVMGGKIDNVYDVINIIREQALY